tara:strand:+ start:3613 stop:4884 length:1272 start_codon:yes stop_codon:yes gene_type:complete
MVIKNWKSVFKSTWYFLSLIFIKREYDVVFVCSSSFNRGKNGENILFKPMIEYCIKNNISYIVFEETYFRSFINFDIDKNSIPLDFITIVQIIFRKIYNLRYKKPTTADQIYYQDLKIAKILKSLFFKKFHSKIYITLIWNNVTLWRSISPSASVVDYQHAYIYDGEDEYMNNGRPPKVKSANNVVAFVHGDRYKRILIDNDKSGFYSENNVITVGVNKNNNFKKRKHLNNRKILFTLQITPDFSKKVNEDYIKIVENLISNNANFLSSNNYKIIFKHHPRCTEDDSKDISIQHDFAVFDNTTPISDLLDEVSLHITFHSTSAFDAALKRVPTIFIDMLEPFSPKEMFLNQYEYPCEDLVINNTYDLEKILVDFENKDIFEKHCSDVHEWYEEFYHDFDEQVFGKFLNEKIYKLNNYTNVRKN